MVEPIIEFNNFSFQYYSQAEPTLHDINLTINRGEKILIAGASGSGKSTLGSCMNGLIPFSYRGEISGSVKVCGRETRNSSLFELSKRVGTVLQDSDGQFVGLTVGEDIAFALENDCRGYDEMHETVDRISALVDMDKLLKASPHELSGGQKQRVAIAGVMVDEVDILLFDEPLANLDPAAGKNCIELIDRLHTEFGKTVIIIEHRLEDVLWRHVDRVVVMNEGRIAADMPPAELLCKSVLPSLGIREPLYITALKYAGVKITPEMRPDSINTIDLSAASEALKAWARLGATKENAPETESILSARDIHFRYDRYRDIIRGISFDIKAGEMVSIVGCNGAGKSTMAKLICGFIHEDSGSFSYRGEEMTGLTIRERADKIGYVMQNPNQMICKSMIYDEVAMGLKLRGMSDEEIKPRVERTLKICGLYPFRKWPVSALSFGQKKRVTIASILVLEPDVLILDEPTAGQDYRHYTEIMEFLRSLNSRGVTVIMITHDMHLMLEYTPHAIVICDGEKIGDSTAVDILTDEEITGRADLKITSLYELAKRAGIDDARGFVQHFIDYEREVRAGEGKAV